MRIGTKGGYISSNLASDRIPLRETNRMNLAIHVMGTPKDGRILAEPGRAA
jgi:hypothetical protein